MSIADKISGLQSSKAALKTSIQNKGVTVPSSTKIDGYATLIGQIPNPEPYESLTVTVTTDETGVTAQGQTVTIYGVDYTVPASGIITAKLSVGTNYTISVNDKDGYNKPADLSYTAASGPRSVTMEYEKIRYGVFILYTDGSLSAYDTLVSGKTTVGVALVNEYVSIVLHPNQASYTWSNTSTEIPNITTTLDINTAKADFGGKANTDAALTYSSSFRPFKQVRNITYADGRVGYLPACGEMEQLLQNVTNINTAMNLIGGTVLNLSGYYGCSTQGGSATTVWRWYNNAWTRGKKSSTYSYRSVAALTLE